MNTQLMTYQYSFVAMTVPCQLLLVGDSEARLADAAHQVMLQTQALEKKYNFYDEASWLHQEINQRSLSHVPLDEETAQVLTTVYRHSQYCEGAFDVAVGTLTSRFRDYDQDDLILRQQSFQHALGLAAWSIDGRILRIEHRDTLFDLGGVIKEYAVDKAMLVLRQLGVSAGLVNFGGDVISWGRKADGSPFRVAIAHPLNAEKICASMTIHNQSLTTSGHGQRYFALGNQQHSHLIGAAQPRLQLVSVVSNSALISGIYSSALLLQPQLFKTTKIHTRVTAFGLDIANNFSPLAR